ncbi:MAG: hypothetical protein R3Y32_02405 [Bacillota bacterium]
MTLIEFVFAMLKQYFGGIASIFFSPIVGLSNILDFGAYAAAIESYMYMNGGVSWLMVIAIIIFMLLVTAMIAFLCYLVIKKILKVTKSMRDQAVLLKEMSRMDRELAHVYAVLDKKIQEELDRMGGEDEELEEVPLEEEEMEDPTQRFTKLILMDEKYAGGYPEKLLKDYTLLDICFNFRNWAATNLRLFFDEEIVREFVAGFSAVRLVILQGISGTGKTSLPYAFGKFLRNDSFIQAIQPSWRERSEMLGYFNEFTKKYYEPEFLRNLYVAQYSNNMFLTVLDEMNIARVEYYFAEFLSILEMPKPDEWIVEIVARSMANDPKFIHEGKMTLPSNMWFIGTANNDDSTFAVSDKVYDRAIIIDIDKKFTPFEPEEGEQMSIDARELYRLFEEARQNNILDPENFRKLEILDSYVIEHFRIAFGNRIMRQVTNFIPAYIECGGTEVNGLDYMIVKKVFRKFASLNISAIRDEIPELLAKLDELWGPDSFPQSREFLERLAKS